MRRRALVVAAAIALGCSKPKRACDEYDQAQRTLDQVSNMTLDPTFGDPRYATALAAFEAIPEDCQQYESAKTIAQTIRTAMAERGQVQDTPAAAEPPPPPPAAAASAPGDDMRRQVAAYLAKLDAADQAGLDEMDEKLVQAIERKRFDAVIADYEKLEASLRLLTPPAPCRQLHAQYVQIASETTSLMRLMEKVIAADDVRAMEALDQRSEALETKIEALEAMRADIERRYAR